MRTRIWQDAAQTLRRKRKFLIAITILIIANVIVWLDVFRGCATTSQVNECDFAFARRPSEIGGGACWRDSIEGSISGQKASTPMAEQQLHIPEIVVSGSGLNCAFRFREEILLLFFLCVGRPKSVEVWDGGDGVRFDFSRFALLLKSFSKCEGKPSQRSDFENSLWFFLFKEKEQR